MSRSPFSSFVEYNGEIYTEITEKEVPNVMPGQYINNIGAIYTPNGYLGPRVRYPVYSSNRYARQKVYLTDGSYIQTTVHRLLMLVFCYQENCENMVVNHINCDTQCNLLSNLEWVTVSENNEWAVKCGSIPIGEDSRLAKLTNDQVKEICKELESPRSYGQLAELARKYNVTEDTIHKIASGKKWTHISKDYNIDYSKNGVDSKLTRDQVIEICEYLSSHERRRGEYQMLADKYNVSTSTIKGIVYGDSWKDISVNYNFGESLNDNLTIEQIEKICSIIDEFGYYDMNVYNTIVSRLNLTPSSKLQHNIRRLYRRDTGCYYYITRKYHWN